MLSFASRRALWSASIGLGLATISCGAASVPVDASPDASRPDASRPDAGGDAVVEGGSTRTDAATRDSAPDVATSDAAPDRCPGSTYVAAPSGAACDPSRIVHRRGLVSPCVAPGVGTLCDSLQIWIGFDEEAKVPAGFVCRTSDLQRICVWSFTDDAGTHPLDAAALEAACAATQALPADTVSCVTYGS